MGALEGRTSPLEGSVGALEGGTSPLEGGVDALEGGVDALEGGVDALEGGVDALEGGVEALEGDVDALEGGLDALEGGTSPLEGGVDALEGGVDALEGGTSPLEGGVDALEGGVDALEGGTSPLEGGVGALEGGVGALEGGISPLEGGPAPGSAPYPASCAPAGCRVDCADPERPLRRDAERNRQRILEAASEVFTEYGLDVSLDEVARRAGVGVGTVYRRFRTKEELVEALFVDRIEAIADVAERAAEEPDPWTGLVSFMEQMAEMLAGDVGLRQMLMFATYGQDQVAYARQRNAPLVEKLVKRAQAAGQVRSDLTLTDIPFIVFVLTQAAELARHARPDIWRRYLALVIDGMRPRREDLTPLPVPALLPDELERTMRQHAPRHR